MVLRSRDGAVGHDTRRRDGEGVLGSFRFERAA